MSRLFFDVTSSNFSAEVRFTVSDGEGHLVGSIGEPDLTTWHRLLRLWAMHPEIDRHQLVFQTPDGAPVLSIDQPRQDFKAGAPKVFDREGAFAGRIGLAPQPRPGEPHVSLYIRGTDGERLGDVRLLAGPTRIGGPKTHGVCDSEGLEIARITGGAGYGQKSFGYDLRLARRLDDPLRTLVTASPIVQYLMLHL
jgi:hypothetical protein